jgi:predicted nuclease with TOPRIM domain
LFAPGSVVMMLYEANLLPKIFHEYKVRNLNVCYFCLLKSTPVPKVNFYNMEQNGYGGLMEKFRQLVAENQSLAARVEEGRQVIEAKDKEIALLAQMLSDAGANQSVMDSKMDEMQHMKDYMTEMNLLMAGVTLTGSPVPPVPEQDSEAAAELEETKELNTYLQIQLKDLKEQLKGLKSRNSELEEKAARAAELESLLANAIEEKNEWKSFVMNKG